MLDLKCGWSTTKSIKKPKAHFLLKTNKQINKSIRMAKPKSTSLVKQLHKPLAEIEVLNRHVKI
jgi:hypothetical protein